MKRYLPSIKQYSWILLVCVALASLAGYALAKAQPTVYQVTATVLVQTGAPGTSITTITSASDPTQSLAEANTYAAEIPTREVMIFIFNQYHQLAARHYTANDMLYDTTAVASATAATVAITASTTNASDAVLLANSVADGFVLYSQQQSQAELNAERTNLTTQLATFQKQQQQLEAKLATIANTSDPNYIFTNYSLASVNKYIDTIQGSLLNLPSTVRSDVTVVQHAEPTDVTTSGKTSTLVAATAGVGLLVGILIMMLLIFLDDRLRSDEEVQKKLGIAYVGAITSKREFASSPMRLSGGAQEEIADVYAGLRLTGLKSGPWHAPQGGVLLVTSVQEAEGKTTIAASLAASYASSGGTVVVMDGNLRKPGTHLAFGMGASGMGLNGLLKSSSNVDDAVQRTNVPGIWILPAGAPIHDPTFLVEQRLPAILAQLRKKTDMIIIDGPSLLSNADALLLASMVDCVALVVDVRHSKVPLLLRAKELLSKLAKTPSGLIMNRASKRKRNNFYATASVIDSDAKIETPASVHNHNGNGHDSSNGQKQEWVVAEVPAIRTATPAPSSLSGSVPLTPGGRPAPNSGPMSIEPPTLSMTSGPMQHFPSSPGVGTDALSMPPGNQATQRPAPPTRRPDRIPPSPARPE